MKYGPIIILLKYIQVHGHRNSYEIDDVNELSYNLEGKVEYGGNLKVLQIQKGLKPNMVKIKNNTYPSTANEFNECR